MCRVAVRFSGLQLLIKPTALREANICRMLLQECDFNYKSLRGVLDISRNNSKPRLGIVIVHALYFCPILKVSGDDCISSKPQWAYCKCQPGRADVLQARLKGLSLYSNIIENRFIGLGRVCVCESAQVQFHRSLS